MVQYFANGRALINLLPVPYLPFEGNSATVEEANAITVFGVFLNW